MTLLDVREPDLVAPEPERAGDDVAVDEGTPVRDAIATVFPSIGAGVMVGGIFTGVSPRVYAALAAVAGVGLAVLVRRVRRPQVGTALIIAGLVALGPLFLVPSGFDRVAHVWAAVRSATSAGSVLRPPVPFAVGWQAVIAWLLGTTAFLAAWVASALRRPALGLLVPLPVAAVAGISVPASAQGASGIAVLVLFAVGLALRPGGRAEDRPPLSYELRRGVRALPIVAGISLALVGLLQMDILLPKPVINPAQEPQKPKTVPLSDVQDRVLFRVKSTVSGPWRIGSLDVYDGNDWRLPPFADNRLGKVPSSGIVDSELPQGVSAEFEIEGLTGAVLPGLPNTVGIRARGPKLSFDKRSGNIRTSEGQVRRGLAYTVVAAALPSVNDLSATTAPIPRSMRQFTKVPSPPPAVTTLIARAPTTSKWAQFDFLRSFVLDNVVAAGTGVPKSIDVNRVQEILTNKEGSPFEIVATQALIARWIGVPSRIGYGFDSGELVGDRLEVHPSNGATFVEVWFPGFKWLPVIGTPKAAKTSVGSNASQRPSPDIAPSNDIAVKVYAFQATSPRGAALKRTRQAVAIVVPILLLAGLAWLLWPVAAKARRRSQRRHAAIVQGPRARVALAYSEWRDLAADFGAGHRGDTPLLFVSRVVPDEEHRQLAWLVTRALWGDLASALTSELAEQAEVLSRALCRRLSRGQPFTLRAAAVLSRRSLRDPFDPTELARESPEKAA